MRRMGLVSVVLIALCGIASAQGVEIFSGQKVNGEFEGPLPRLFRFEADAGDLLTLSVTPGKSSPYDLEVGLFGPGGAVTLPALVGGKLKAKKVLIPQPGTYILVVGGEGIRSGATFKLALTMKVLKRPAVEQSTPGTYTFFVPRGSELTITVKGAKGSGLKPRIAGFHDSAGDDRIVAAKKATDTKLTKVPCIRSGPCSLTLEGLGGTTGNALVTVKRKPWKPVPKKLAAEDLVDTYLVKALADGRYVLVARVDGDRVTGASFTHPVTGAVTVLDPGRDYFGGPFATEAELDAAYPDEIWEVAANMDDGKRVTTQIRLAGALPGAVTVTEASTSRVTFTGGAGSAYSFVIASDLYAENDLYTTGRSSPATSFDLPRGAVPDAWPVLYQVVAYNGTGKMALHGVAANTDGGEWIGAISIGDLVEFDIDPLGGRFEYEVLEGLLVGQSAAGDLDPVPGASSHLFTVVDDGDTDKSYVAALPGRIFVLGEEDTLIAAVPRRSTAYPVAEITGLYNFLVLECGSVDCSSGYGTLRIENGTWEVWEGKNAVGASTGTGTWTDQGNGVIHVFEDRGSGPERGGNVMFIPGPTGGRLLVMDLLDGGILIGVPQVKINSGDMDGTWEFLATTDEDYVELSGSKKTLYSPDEKIPLAFNKPWTGFVSGGSKKEPGYGLLSPDGIFVLAGENEQENLPGETEGWLGIAIRK